MVAKIGIDIQTTLGQKTGFGFYVSNLTEQLKKIDKKNKYAFFKPAEERDFNAPRRFLWDQFKLPRLARAAHVDLLHQPAFSAPVFFKGKTVVTVHDIIAILFGGDIPFYSRQYFARWMPFSYRFADKIICVSEHTKQDLIKHLGVPEEKMVVIPEAAGSRFKPIKDRRKIDKILDKYYIDGRYILHIGTLNPRKNLEFLIRVFNRIHKMMPDIKLVITGKKGWYYENLFEAVRHLGLEKFIIFTGYIEDEEAPYLYNGADVYAFPSIYEGFGLPPLEAMSCGTPVVASNTSSIPEVVGDAGVLLSPKDVESWVKAILRILRDKPLREKMTTASLKQAKKFSWRKTARQTVEVYEEVLRG